MKAARRRWSFSGLLAASGLIGLAAITRAAAAPNAQPSRTHATQGGRSTPATPALVTAVTRVDIVVRDLARSRPFFELLGFTPVREEELGGDAEAARTGIAGARVRQLELALGDERLALREFLAPAGAGRPVPPDTRGNDRWFQHVALVVSDMDRAYAWLRRHHVAHVSSGPQTLPAWNRAAGGIRAFYFADPDGHALELIQFPRGKGDARWQARRTCRRTPVELCLFLGIDHTAITVESTDASLAFYRDQLGLRVAGESENYGTEQEHLNGVFAARLRITALRATKGPGIELLEYLSPRGGRPTPPDVRADDLVHYQVVAETTDTAAVASAAVAAGGRNVSSRARGGEALLRDRDGHALLVRAPATP